MNKRIRNKLLKQRNKEIEVSGNNGGDIFKIINNDDGTVRLFIGHCCVVIIDKIVPVEFLTATLAKIILEHDNNVYSIISDFDWDEKFKEELKKKMK